MNHHQNDRNVDTVLTPDERQKWQIALQAVNRNNVFCHCRSCGYEWVSSAPDRCVCGSTHVESILCWQFPDD